MIKVTREGKQDLMSERDFKSEFCLDKATPESLSSVDFLS